MNDEDTIKAILNEHVDLLSAARWYQAQMEAEQIRDMSLSEIANAMMDGGFDGCDDMTPEQLAPSFVDEFEPNEAAARVFFADILKEIMI